MSVTPAVSGYRHVYLEGMEEASIFVHVAVSDISGKVSATCKVTCCWKGVPQPQPHPIRVPGAMRPSAYLDGPVSPSTKRVAGPPGAPLCPGASVATSIWKPWPFLGSRGPSRLS